ncbi:hypothetical protein GRS96_09625 [Rathayibacter sp. VKM Ac-2803]|nr:hypothetical protein [Rathayibacter sp. VKM Ac-2803]
MLATEIVAQGQVIESRHQKMLAAASPDLSGSDLSGSDLSGSDLSGSDLERLSGRRRTGTAPRGAGRARCRRWGAG